MRIGLQATNIFFEGPKHAGVSRTSLRLLEAILAHREHHYVVFVRPESPIPEHWKSLGHVEVCRTWKKTRTWHHIGRDLEPILHRLGAWFSVSGYVPRTPLITKASLVHDTFWRKYPETYTQEDIEIHEAMAQNIAKFSTFIAANSQATVRDFSSTYKVPSSRFLVLPFGVGQDTVASSPFPRPTCLPNDREYLFTISTLEPRKNLPRLFEAFAIIANRPAFVDTDLVIAGVKGWKTDGILEKVAELGIQDRVHFLGFVPDAEVPALFHHAKVAVTASLDEGFGVPVLEAMTYGSVIAASNVPALREIGLEIPIYFDPNSPKAIAAGIEFAATDIDRELRRSRGLVRATEFSWDQSAQMVLNRLTKR